MMLRHSLIGRRSCNAPATPRPGYSQRRTACSWRERRRNHRLATRPTRKMTARAPVCYVEDPEGGGGRWRALGYRWSVSTEARPTRSLLGAV